MTLTSQPARPHSQPLAGNEYYNWGLRDPSYVELTPQDRSRIEAQLSQLGIPHAETIRQIEYFPYNSRAYRVTGGDAELCAKELIGERWKKEGFAAGYARTLHTLAAQGAPVIAPTDSQSRYDGTDLWMTFPFVNAQYYTGEPQQAEQLGRALARMHKALKEIDDPFLVQCAQNQEALKKYGYLPTPRDVTRAIDLGSRTPPGVSIETVLSPARALLASEQSNLTHAAYFVEHHLGEFWKSAPQQIVHGDVTHKNILCTTDITLVDFEKMLLQSPLLDLGSAIASTLHSQSLLKGPGSGKQSTDALIHSYSGASGMEIDRDQALAYALVVNLHLALLNVKNLFENGFTRGLPTFPRHVKEVGILFHEVMAVRR
jgi:Ser/Thr protein kinase RdoA (MazF antagonist)